MSCVSGAASSLVSSGELLSASRQAVSICRAQPCSQLRVTALACSAESAISSCASKAFTGRKFPGRLRSPPRRQPRRFLVSAIASEPTGTEDAALGVTNGTALELEAEETLKQKVAELEARLLSMEAAVTATEKDKASALEAAAAADAKAEELASTMVATTEEAMAEVKRAKESFQAELAKAEDEKTELQEQLAQAKQEGLELAMKVEKMASIAVQEQTLVITEEAKLRIAAAQAEAAEVALQMESKVRIAADEAAASVIEEAKATIEDAIAAADIAKEQARTAELALQEKLGVLDTLSETEAQLMRAEDEIAALKIKVRLGEQEKESLRMEIKAAIARAEAAESKIIATQAAVAEIQALSEKSAREREAATEKALETMRVAASSKEKAASLAYKAETDSLRAAALAAQRAGQVKEQAMERRFAALHRSLTAAEDAKQKWKERCLAVEELLTLIKDKGFNVLREAGEVEDLLNRGRMDVMLGDQAEKWQIMAEGPRRDRPGWLLEKTQQALKLPPLRALGISSSSAVTSPTADVESSITLPLPSPDEVWSIAKHQVADDVFTREAEKREAESKEIEEKRKELEKALQTKAPAKRIKTPDELEETKEPGTGTGREIVFQGFNWESNKKSWYLELAPRAADLAASGITAIWLPPPTDSVSPEGYMPTDYYNLNSKYGTLEELQFLIDELHNHNLTALGDVVLNHRCAAKQNKEGIWNIFGGKLAWGPEAIVRDDPNFHGRGNPSSGDFFHAAPNVDHSQDFVRKDIKEWLRWLRAEVGYDGWRLDFARGFWGGYVKEYIEASSPAFCIGEYWDSLAYEGGNPAYNQNAHRQRIINWINATGGTSSAFDVTTKGILHSALHNEFWRLIDPQGKPPGVMGWWPSRAVTFLENHDTGSTQAHWPFPRDKVMMGYAYILTHPGTPVVFYDHFYDFGLHDPIAELIAARNHCGIHCRSPIKIFHANAQGYVAMVGEKLVVKLGHFDWNPSRQNDLMGRWEKMIDKGNDYIIWEKQ